MNATTLQVGQATNSWGNVVDVANGTVNVNNNLIFGKWGYDNRMKVHDGGKVTVGDTFKWSLNESGVASNNVMAVLSGGEVVAKEFIPYGTNRTLVVSNGTIRTTNEKAHGIQLPWCNNDRDWDFTLQVPNGRFGIFDDDNGNFPDVQFDVSACGMRTVRSVTAEGNPFWIKPTMLTRMQANPPENCKLKVADNKLTLTVNEFGMNIIIR